jgi:hypothetical protein
MNGKVDLIDGRWVLTDNSGEQHLLGSEMSPETVMLLQSPTESGGLSIADAILFPGSERPDASLPYYAEPGMDGVLTLVDGYWVLKDNAGAGHIVTSEIPPEIVALLVNPEEQGSSMLPDTRFLPGNEKPEASLAYAETGMVGTIDLVEGKWVLRDQMGEIHLLGNEAAPETVELLQGPLETTRLAVGDSAVILPGNETPETSLSYAEPGMLGTINLVDGNWVLKDMSGRDHLLGNAVPPEAIISLPNPIENSAVSVDDGIILPGNENPEISLSYAEPGMKGTIDLIDGYWVLKDTAGNSHLLGSGLPPEALVLLTAPQDTNTNGRTLIDAILLPGSEDAEISLPYAEPGMQGTIELIDGYWFIKDAEGENHLVMSSVPPEAIAPFQSNLENNALLITDAMVLPGREGPETSLAYAEPGMRGTINLVDGNWVLTDTSGADHLLGSEVRPEAGTVLTNPDENNVDGRSIADAILFPGREFVEASLPYAEPGMIGKIDLLEGKWVLKDSDGIMHVLGDDLPPEDIVPLENPRELGIGGASIAGAILLPGNEGAQASLPYAEPGILGTIDLIDGKWIIKDNNGETHIIGTNVAPEVVMPFISPDSSGINRNAAIDNNLLPGGEVETSLPYAEPGMVGKIELVDGRWELSDDRGESYVIGNDIPPEAVVPLPNPESGIGAGRIADSLLLPGNEGAQVSLSYVEPGMRGVISLIDGRWILSDENGEDHIINSDVPPEAFMPLLYPDTNERILSGSIVFPGEENAEISLPYAEPGMKGRIDLVDGRWVLKDDDGNYRLITSDFSPETAHSPVNPPEGSADDLLNAIAFPGEENAETSLPYAKPGMEGQIYLVDGRWVLKDQSGRNFLVTSDSLPPEYVQPLFMPDDTIVGHPSDSQLGVGDGIPDESVRLAEPGMIGKIELADGRWILKDDDGNEWFVNTELPPEYIRPLFLPDGSRLGTDIRLSSEEDNPETSFAYAEPGLLGVIELVDGHWIITDIATGKEYFVNSEFPVEYIPPGLLPDDNLVNEIRDLQLGVGGDNPDTSFPLEDPGILGKFDLVDGHWIFRGAGDKEWLGDMPPEYIARGLYPDDDLIDVIRDLQLGVGGDNPDTSFPLADPGMFEKFELADGRWVFRNADGKEWLGDMPPEYVVPGLLPDDRLVDAIRDLQLGVGGDNPDTSIPLAEPGMFGQVELADGRWILKDTDGKEWLVTDGLPPEYVPFGSLPDDNRAVSLDTSRLGAGGRYPDTSFPLADPGMTGSIELVDGRWLLKDNNGKIWLINSNFGPEYTDSLVPPDSRPGSLSAFISKFDGPETSLPYVEPGMKGTIELIDGRWFLLNSSGGEYLFGDDAGPEYSMSAVPLDSSGVIRLGNEPVIKDLPEYNGMTQAPSGSSTRLGNEPDMEDLADFLSTISPKDEVYEIITEPRFKDKVEISSNNTYDNTYDIDVFLEPGEYGLPRITKVKKIPEGFIIVIIKEPSIEDILEVYQLEEDEKQRTVYLDVFGMEGSADRPPEEIYRLGQVHPEDRGVGIEYEDQPIIRDGNGEYIYPPIHMEYDGENIYPNVRIEKNKPRVSAILNGIPSRNLYPPAIYNKKPSDTARPQNTKFVERLQKGKYYLQLGYYTGKTNLENELSKLNKVYPYTVEAGYDDKPVYKLLLGPVNEGESNALLQRLQSEGRNDVFIRHYE